ncbi:WD40 repeat-like protein [Trichoderma citrinoviride]|uniref:WD40 repeat-like protein n=1 Tax=Trichoderma citrinoviride TaxID=58853 RepID=A0A2T4BB50_9HYPO|nr:WD40 repeat-like protein [Trichoderma citrinoviride]PTB66461.1 WD40 repeat-like protein [Trichoderma citrinoviride]
MPRLLNKLKEKWSTRDPNKDKQVHVPIEPDPPPVPNGSTAVPMPPASTEPVIEPKPLQGRLWNEAYELLKLSNAELVEAYEKILSRELLHDQGCVSKPASLENRIDAAYGGRWKQMHTIVNAALKRQEERAEKCLKDLRVTDPRDDKSRIEDTNGGLLQDAYGWAIGHTDFIAWRDEKENHLLWIKGDPGKGKTMLMCGIIDELQSCDISPCYFFCQATDPRLNNATAVLRGLIYLLLQEKHDQAGAALFQDANSWVVLSQMFTKLLDDPSLDGQVFMVDALDECQADLERLLDLIVGTSANPHAKWIVSSRNWTTIGAKLGTVSQNIRFSLELNEQSVSEAVRFFVSHKAAQLRNAKGLDEEMEQKVRTYLTDNARGTFLWVALVCKELLKLGVRKRHLLKKMAEFPSDLGPLYERMMQQIRESEDSDLCEKILRLVAVVYRPVTLAELASLLDMEDAFSGDELEEIVAACDFLLRDKMVAPRIGSQHYAVFSRSLQILSTTLRRDMYNLRHPGALIEEYAPNQDQDQDVLRHARYSCIYWINHLKAVNDLDREKCVLSLQDDGVVHRFLNNKLLNWLEACSLIRSIPDAARAVRILRSLALVHDCTMRNLIEDVYRFVLYHKVGIGLAPLQVYCSALIFSPKSSLVRLLYEDTEVPKWVVKKPDMPSRWTARLHFLEGHTDTVDAVAFSSDGTQLASGSGDGIAKIWDTETGTCLHTFTCLSSYLAAGSWRGVEVWDAMSSTSIYTFYDDYSARLAAVHSSDTESFIRTWDLGTGMEVKTHHLHQHQCRATAFAPDGTHLASVADQNGMFSLDASRLAVAMAGCIYIFEASTGECLQELQDDSWFFEFLADSQRLMSVSQDASSRIWDTTTGTCLRQLSGVPSPDGMFIAETRDGRYYPAQNIDTTEETTKALTAIAFSPDGAQLATASISETEGKIIRIRDSLTSACLTDFPWSGTSITSLAFFPDGKRLASRVENCIGIWDIATGLNVQTIGLESPLKWLHATILFYDSPIAISSNGDLVAAIFGRDPHVVMWDLTSGAISKQFYFGNDIPNDWPVAAVFSPDDTKLGLLSGLGTISICDINTGDIIFIHLFEPLDISQPCPLQLRNELQHLIGQSEGSDQSLKQAQPRIFDMSGFNISRDGTWMLKRQQRVLWLPPDYRPINIVLRDGSVVIQSRFDGPGHFFRFAVDDLDALLA